MAVSWLRFVQRKSYHDADRPLLLACSIDFEKRHGVEYEDTAFGDNWRRRRFRKHPAAGPLGWLAMHRYATGVAPDAEWVTAI